MLSGQNEEINKRRSMNLAMLQKRRIIVEEGAADDLQNLYEEANKPDGFMVLNPGGRSKMEIIEGAQLSQYQIQVLELTFFEIMVWVTAGNLCRSLCTPLMARLAARIGWKNVTALTIAMMACVAALWAAATRQNAAYLFPVLSILGAVPYAGMGVGFLKMQVATSPSATRSMYFSVNSLFNGASALLGSVLCSALIGVLEVLQSQFLIKTGILL